MQAQFIPSQSLNPLVFRVILGGQVVGYIRYYLLPSTWAAIPLTAVPLTQSSDSLRST